MVVLGNFKKLFKFLDSFQGFLEFLIVTIKSCSVSSSIKTQILNPVVSTNAIDVVNRFTFEKWPSEILSHYQSVFQNSWRTIHSFLAHPYITTKRLILYTKTRNDQKNVTTRRNTFVVILFRTWITTCNGMFFRITRSAKSRIIFAISNGIHDSKSKYFPCFTTKTTSNLKNSVTVILYVPFIPMNLTSIFKLYEFGFYGLRMRFSRHVFSPSYIITQSA